VRSVGLGQKIAIKDMIMAKKTRPGGGSRPQDGSGGGKGKPGGRRGGKKTGACPSGGPSGGKGGGRGSGKNRRSGKNTGLCVDYGPFVTIACVAMTEEYEWFWTDGLRVYTNRSTAITVG